RPHSLDLDDPRLYLRIERRVDELVGQIQLLRTLVDGDRIDSDDGTFLRHHQLYVDALVNVVEGVARQDDLDWRFPVRDLLLAGRVRRVEGLDVRLQFLEQRLALF